MEPAVAPGAASGRAACRDMARRVAAGASAASASNGSTFWRAVPQAPPGRAARSSGLVSSLAAVENRARCARATPRAVSSAMGRPMGPSHGSPVTPLERRLNQPVAHWTSILATCR